MRDSLISLNPTPHKTMQTLIVVGYGKMAKSLALGLRDKYRLKVCGRNNAKIQSFCDELGLTPLFLEDSTILVEGEEILLCIKPNALKEFRFQGKSQCVYSILNAVSIATLKESLESKNYIRAMPNVCASVKQSLTSLCSDESCDEFYKKKACEIFESIGESLWIEERLFPIATALGGCAPAFLSLIAESLIDGGVTYGLTRQEATNIVQTLFSGFSELLKQNHPVLLKESVMSPGGSTAQGVAVLEKCAVKSAFLEAILASKNFA